VSHSQVLLMFLGFVKLVCCFAGSGAAGFLFNALLQYYVQHQHNNMHTLLHYANVKRTNARPDKNVAQRQHVTDDVVVEDRTHVDGIMNEALVN